MVTVKTTRNGHPMKMLLGVTAVVAAAALAVVQPLTSFNFDETIKKEELWLVKFYAPCAPPATE